VCFSKHMESYNTLNFKLYLSITRVNFILFICKRQYIKSYLFRPKWAIVRLSIKMRTYVKEAFKHITFYVRDINPQKYLFIVRFTTLSAPHTV